MTDLTCPDSVEATPDVHRERSRLEIWLIIFALAVGGFAIGTGEFAVMAVLPDIAQTYSVTISQAGYVISAYALGVFVGAPIIAMLSARISRRNLALAAMLIFTAGNLLSAVAPEFISFTGLRFFSALPHGAYFGVASLIAASLVPPNRRARAVGSMMLGLTIATLAGTPLTALLGQVFGWQSMFVTVGLLGFATMVLCWFYLPHDKVVEGASMMRELSAFKRPQVLLTLLVATTGFGGMFAVVSYIAPTATELANMSVYWVPVIMAIFGVGMNVGNVVGGRLADISIMGTIGGVLTYNIALMLTFSFIAANPVMLCICVFLVGCTFAVIPAVQTRLMDVAADGQTLAAASMHSAFNAANALGAWLGGWTIALGLGFASTGYVGVALGVVGLSIFAVSWRLEIAERRQTTER